MKCALASMGFINEDIEYNKNVILETMIKYALWQKNMELEFHLDL